MVTVIQGADELHAYRQVLQILLLAGEKVSPRGQATLALQNVIIEHQDPGDVLLTGIGRKLSPGLLALEPLQLVGGFSDPELTIATVPHYANFADVRASGARFFWGAYGARLRDKVGLVAERLKKDPATRQAHVSFWDDIWDLESEGKKDYPCTISAHFEMSADGKLNGTTVMRSNDAWLGYPYDVVQHTCLLKTLARFLDVPVGSYTHIVHNMHLYERDIEKARQLLLDTVNFTDERLRLDGGIGTGDESTWGMVQQRARSLCYRPCAIDPATPEETFYKNIMLDITGGTP